MAPEKKDLYRDSQTNPFSFAPTLLTDVRKPPTVPPSIFLPFAGNPQTQLLLSNCLITGKKTTLTKIMTTAMTLITTRRMMTVTTLKIATTTTMLLPQVSKSLTTLLVWIF